MKRLLAVKGPDLGSLAPRKSQALGERIWNSSTEGRGVDKRIPGAHWLSRLANQ